MTINLRADAPSQVTQTEPQKLTDEIKKLQDIQQEIQNYKDRIKDLEESEKYFSQVVIPDMMNAMNLKTMKLKDGSEIEISNKFFANALAAKRAEAYQWLRENGLGNIVKNEITVRFGKDEDNKAMQYATLARGQGYEPEQKVSVHAGTLRVALRDLHERGGQIPSEYFSTFAGYRTKITGKSKSTD
tara:strand:- start:173 stop:733 length:561 start_codon:yes stop_codon:yes gene_type:complete